MNHRGKMTVSTKSHRLYLLTYNVYPAGTYIYYNEVEVDNDETMKKRDKKGCDHFDINLINLNT